MDLTGSYELCRTLHRRHGRTYYLATRLLPAKLNASNDPGGVRLRAAVARVRAMFADVLDERRRDPRDDIPSYLLSQELDGRPLTELCLTPGAITSTYCNNTVLRMPPVADEAEDKRRMRATGRR